MNSITPRPIIRKSLSLSLLLLAFILGCLLPLGFAPFDYWWLSMLSVGCFPLILAKSKGFIRGWAYGAGVFTFGISWVFVSLYQYSGAGWATSAVATLALGVSLGLFFGGLGLAHQQIPQRYYHPILFAGLWVCFEWIRSWLFTGFPWLYLGYSALELPLMQHWIPIIGVYGCSFLIALWCSIVLEGLKLFLHQRSIQSIPLHSIALVIGLPLVSSLLAEHEWTQSGSETLTLALIQGNIDQADKWDPLKAPLIAQQYMEMTQQAISDGAELVIWPEAALPNIYSQAQKTLEKTRALLNQAPQQPQLMTGLLTDNQASQRPIQESANTIGDQLPKIRNSILLLGQDLAADHLYHKQRLVPFGEYLPFADQLIQVMPFLGAFRHGITAGSTHQASLQSKSWSIQPLICYEIAFPGLAFASVNRAPTLGSAALADAILTISNDGWFGLSHGPNQHFQMAQFRAKAFGRPVIRATNTGITGIIDHTGAVQASLPRQQPGVLFYTLHKVKGSPPYARYGPRGVLYGILIITIVSFAYKLRHEGLIKIEKQ